ncbi:MAG TPA: 50S ribosomal protein L21 [Solirubrobacterales bacterium]
MASYAVIETGGKQYRVEKGSTLLVDRLSAKEGDKVDLRAVAFRDKEMVLGKDLEKVKVEAKVAAHERGPKVRVFKYRPKKGYRRRAGHRSELTRLEITDVKMLTRKPARTKSSATRTADGSTGTRSTASSGTRSTAKKPAAKKEQSDGS